MSEDATSRDLTDADIHGSSEKPSKQPPLPNRRTLDAFDATEKSHNHPIQPTTSERSTRGELHGGKPASRGAQGGDEKHKTLAYAPGLPPPRRVSRLTNNVSMEVKDICNTADTSHSVNRARHPRDRALEEYAVKTAIRIATGDTDGTKGKTLAYAPARAQSYALSSMDDSNSDNQEAPQRESTIAAPGAYAVRGIDYQPGDDSIEPSMHTMSNAESQDQTYIQGIDAELVTDTDTVSMEERIVKRIFHQAPVAEVKPNSVQSDDNAPASRKKLWIILVAVALLVIAGAVVGIVFALQKPDPAVDPPSTVPPEPDWSSDVCIEYENEDGTMSIGCVIEQHPSPELMTVFRDCPDLEGENVLGCDACVVVMARNIQEWDLEDPTCNICTICGDNVSYDCTNISPNEQCAKTNCAGECVN